MTRFSRFLIFVFLFPGFLLPLGNKGFCQEKGMNTTGGSNLSNKDIKQAISKQMGIRTQGKSAVYENFFKLQDSYVPRNNKVEPQTVPVSLKVRFVVLEKNNTGPLQTNFRPRDTAELNLMINWLNQMFSTLAKPARPVTAVCGDCYIKDERIRLDLTGIDFINDTVAYRNPVNTYLLDRQGTDKDRILNIYLYVDSGSFAPQYTPAFFSGGAWSNFGGALSGPVVKTDLGVFMMNTYLTEKTYPKYDSRATEHGMLWLETMRLFHELHHVLGLGHLQRDQGGNHGFDPGGCSGPDYLSDAFPDGCPMSYQDHKTNNIMNSAGWSNYLSPLQIGRVHRSVFLGIVSKYSYPVEAPEEHPWIIDHDQTWDFSIRIFQNIVVRKGVTLTVSGLIQMPPGGRIMVEKGGRVIVDKGMITGYNEDSQWLGIRLGSKRDSSGIVTLLNGGEIRGAGQ